MQKTRLTLVLAGVALLSAACAATSESSGVNRLAYTDWEVTSFDDQGSMITPDPATMITASFGLTEVSGSTGVCNLYTLPYSLDGSSLGLGSLSITGAACPSPDFSAQADAFIRALEASKKYELDDRVLRMLDREGRMMLSLRPAETLPLTGISWLLTSYRSEAGLLSPLAGSTVSLNFLANGTLAGIAGCNSYFADYVKADPALTITNLGYTEMECSEPAGIMAQEAGYLAALGRVDSIQTSLTGLTLLDSVSGDIVAEFRFGGRVR